MLAIFEVISLAQKASFFYIFVLTLSTMDFNYSCVGNIFDEETFSFPAVILFPCFAFLCLVKPPFDLQILSQFSQGKLFSPGISLTASATSSSIVASSSSIKNNAISKFAFDNVARTTFAFQFPGNRYNLP